VARVLDVMILRALTFTRQQVELIGWATIFRTLDQAETWRDALKH
jgi:hypothetical protein